MKASRSGNNILPSSSNSLRINGSLDATYILDSGADAALVSRVLVDALGIKGCLVESPVEFSSVVEGQTLVCDQAVVLNLELQTIAGPLFLRDVYCYIVETQLEDVLLGDNVLKGLGIDVDQLLANVVHQREDEMEMANDTFSVEVGFVVENEIDTALEILLGDAAEQGLEGKDLKEVTNLTYAFRDVWRTRLGPDPPARVPPMEVKLETGSRPVRCKTRKYPPLHRKFLQQHFATLERFGLVYRNHTARYGSPALVVGKVPNPTDVEAHFRATVDLRAVNAITIPIVYPMPNLDTIQEALSNSRCFQLFDFFKGYWQLPLAKESQEIHSIITDSEVFTPTRVVQGGVDAVLHFQSTMNTCFRKHLVTSLIIWLDDLMNHAKSTDELIRIYRFILETCRTYGLKLNARKCKLFLREAKFLGRIFTPKGVHHDPERVNALVNASEPTNAGELQQFLCAMNWISNCLPDFSRASKPLKDVLEMSLRGQGRTAKAARNIPIQLDRKQQSCFGDLKDLVAKATYQAHPDEDAEFCVCTDASSEGWAAVLFQVKGFKEATGLEDQECEPLSFLGGIFRGSSYGWSIAEKEAFPIVEAVERWSYLLIRPKGFRIFCDHRNLTYIFDTSDSLMKLPTSHKLQRWALKLSAYRYVIEHIAGEKNVWADMLTRWALPSKRVYMAKRQTRGKKRVPLISPLTKDFVWPNLESIGVAQQFFVSTKYQQEQELVRKGDLLYHRGRVWIPNRDDLRERVLIVAHFGLSGHRGAHSTYQSLKQFCSWRGQEEDVKKFLSECLHCLQVKGGKTIPRPLGETITATRPNQILHLDYLYIGEGEGNVKYILVLKDGLSHFCELVAAEAPVGAIAGTVLFDWFKRFGSPQVMVSDQGTHFKNELIASITRMTQIEHHFTTAYCAWANGTVERMNVEILKVLRALLGEKKWDRTHWPRLLPMVQWILNNSIVESLGNRAPLTVFTGLEPKSPVGVVFDDCHNMAEVPMDDPEHVKNLEQLRTAMHQMHKDVESRKHKRHERNNRSQRGIQAPDFQMGDFVLWANINSITRRAEGNKLQSVWKGPFRVVGTKSKCVFRIQHLVTGKTMDAHVTRMKFYADDNLELTEELVEHVSNQGFELLVEAINDYRYADQRKSWELLLSWSGFEQVEDSWEPMAAILADVPQLTLDYLNSVYDPKDSRFKAMKRDMTSAFTALRRKRPSLNFGRLSSL